MSESVEDYTAILAYLDSPNRRFNAFTDLGTPVVVTYSFNENDELPPGSAGYYGVDSFASFTNYQRDMMRQVLDEAGDVAGLIFVEVDGGDAMINMYSGLDGDGGGVSASGYAGYGMGLETATYGSDLVMIYQDFAPGGFTYQVLLHELGHALGLSHPHEGDHVLHDDHDHNFNSVMTYSHSWDHAEEYGTFDIQALAHLYGDKSEIKGYKSSVNKDGMIVVTASNRKDDLIAADSGSKLIGLDHNDNLYGREGDDILEGGQGKDFLKGAMGEDILKGGRNDDVMMGDTGEFYMGHNDVLKGGKGRDDMSGDGGDDRLEGNIGGDTLDGGYGADRLIGGKGNDRVIGGHGDDRMTGGQGRDTFVFSNRDNGNTDTITDFTGDDDTLDFSAMQFINSGSLSVTQVGDDTQIYSAGYSFRLMLEDFDHSTLDMADVTFA